MSKQELEVKDTKQMVQHVDNILQWRHLDESSLQVMMAYRAPAHPSSSISQKHNDVRTKNMDADRSHNQNEHGNMFALYRRGYQTYEIVR